MLICQYCSKSCINANSHRNHERCCPINPNRNYKNGMIGKTGWNKGLTKDTDDRVRAGAEKYKNNILSGDYIPHRTPHTLEIKEHLSAVMQDKMQNRYTASKRIEYKGIRFESSWEYEVALDLDKNNINWTRPLPLLYIDNGQQRRYYPDFYLPEYDVYLDPKNDYVKILDKEKISNVMSQNNVKIYLLSKSQLSWTSIKEIIGLQV